MVLIILPAFFILFILPIWVLINTCNTREDLAKVQRKCNEIDSQLYLLKAKDKKQQNADQASKAYERYKQRATAAPSKNINVAAEFFSLQTKQAHVKALENKLFNDENDTIVEIRQDVNVIGEVVSELVEGIAPKKADADDRAEDESNVDSKAAQILEKIWNWFLFGVEGKPTNVSTEFALATTWLPRLGIIILVLGLGFSLKYSIDHNLIGPGTRVIMCFLTGLGLVIGGVRQLGRKYHILGHALIGGGFATLYFSIFAAGMMHNLISIPVAYGLMIAITAGACFTAVKTDTLLIAILAVIGGFGTPLMLDATGFISICSYMVILNIGLIFVARYKNWHLLNYLSFFATYILVVFALVHSPQAPLLAVTLTYLTIFFVIYSLLSYFHNIINKEKSTLIELVILSLNSLFYSFLGATAILQDYGKKEVGIFTLLIALYYVVKATVFMKKRLTDKELITVLLAHSGFFLALTVPLVISAKWLTFAWAVQAFLMLWVGKRINSNCVRSISYLVYTIVLMRFLFVEINTLYSDWVPVQYTFIQYLKAVIVRSILFLAPVASFAGGAFLMAKKSEADNANLALGDDNNFEIGFTDSQLVKVGVTVASIGLFIFLHLEINKSLEFLYNPLRLPALTLLWAGLFVTMHWLSRRFNSTVLKQIAWVATAIIILKILVIDLNKWDIKADSLVYFCEYSFSNILMRSIDFIPAIAVYYYFGLKVEKNEDVARSFRIIATVLLLIFTTLEVATCCQLFAPAFKAGAISIVWSIFALTFMILGIKRQNKTLRYSGLAFFAIIIPKVFFYDLAHTSTLWRVAAFIILGILVLTGAFFYIRERQQFEMQSEVS